MALAVVRDLQEHRVPATEDELADFETDVLAGFVLARASAGLVDSTIRNDTNHLELIRADGVLRVPRAATQGRTAQPHRPCHRVPTRRDQPAKRRYGGEHRPITGPAVRELITHALAGTGLTDVSGRPLRFVPHDFRRILITDAIMHGMPPHIAQLVAGHRDINVTMGYKAVYPEEVINGHRAFIARRRALRPSEEYRTPTEEEWTEFLGHFERRKVSLGTCGRSYATACIHEHACVRCPLLRPDPAQRPRLVELCDNLGARIGEAEREGWLGEVDGLQVSLAAARNKLTQLDELATRTTAVTLGMPTTAPAP